MNWKKKVFEFWDDSIYFYEHFDFYNFFQEFKKVLLRKLATHGMSSFKDYLKFIGRYYDFTELEQFTYESKHTGVKWDLKDLKALIFYPRYEHFRKKHEHNLKYEILQDLYKDLLLWESKHNHSSTENLLLIDRCIHAIHNSGNLLNLDLDKLREEYEKKN